MDVRWQRATRRSVVMGAVIAAHVAVLLWVVAPPAARPLVRRRRTPQSDVMQIELIEPHPSESAPASPPQRSIHSIAHATRVAIATPRRIRRTRTPRVTLLATPAAASSVAPTFIAGGDFARRLRHSRLTPRPPKLPGGQRYLAANLHFVPLSQESLAGKIHRISALIGLHWFDPVCKDARLELTHSRLRQIADGYTPGDLQRLLREHHCN